VGGITLSGASVLSGNGTFGLTAYSRGAIAAANVTAEGNTGYAAYIVNTAGGDGTGTVTLSGTNVFRDNGQGVYIESLRAITLSNVTVSGTVTGTGATLYNAGVDASGGVTLSGTNRFEDNDGDGLYVSSLGAIAVSAVTASGNGTGGSFSGATLNNFNAPTPQTVKLTGMSVFNDNHGNGLAVRSKGAISAAGITASGNSLGSGARLDNEELDAVGGVTLTGTNTFSDNEYYGLVVNTLGAVTLNAVTASGNGGVFGYSGAEIRNQAATTPQPVKLTGTNVFNNNTYRGLDVLSAGTITVSSLTASDNGDEGATLLNNYTGSTGGVTLSGTNTFEGNGHVGLHMESYGALTLNSVTSSGNLRGAYLRNQDSPTAQALKLTGTNSFNDNTQYGLDASSAGAITINNLTARGNTAGDGAYLHNTFGSAGITLTGTNVFNTNGSNGLTLETHGAVSLTKVTADDNASRGLSVTMPVASLTITCGSMTANGTYGIYADSTGLIKLIGVVSAGNGTTPDYLDGSDTEFIRTCPLP
jgi:hypothetical protein